MSDSIRDTIIYEIVQTGHQMVRNTTPSERSNLISENRRSIEKIIADTASAFNRPKQQLIITDPSTPSIDDLIYDDGILGTVLSNLSLREAVATSVLSPRWRNIWTRRPHLDFGAKNMFDDHIKYLIYHTDAPINKEEKIELMLGKTDQFICSVNSVMHQLHLQGRSRINEFKVRYYLHKIHSHHLDAWVRFAVESKTSMLGLYLHKPFDLDSDEEKYDFPCHLLGSPSVQELFLVSCSLKPPLIFPGLNNLKKLTLYYVDVTEEDITRLLSNCYTLEYLKLYRLPQLTSLNVPHPQSRFQTFIAKGCLQLRGEIKIDAVNLKNLGYHGYLVDFILRQSSQLFDAFICFQTEEIESSLDFYLNKLSSNMPHLRNLICTVVGDAKVSNLSIVPRIFTHLKYLAWNWSVHGQKMTLGHLATLLEAAPFLEILSLNIRSISDVEEAAPESLDNLRQMLPKRPHAHLKKLTFVCFFWDKLYVEFTVYLIMNAIELESMDIICGEELGELTAEKLRKELPAKIKLQFRSLR